jgi:hypothetical protein
MSLNAMQSITNPYGNNTSASLKPTSNGSDNMHGGGNSGSFNNINNGNIENNENI